MNRYETGLSGERAAEKWLAKKRGMRCEARRFRAAGGEIDLVMLDGETVVFVEVKTRPTGPQGAGIQAVTPDKQRRMTQAAMMYLMKRGWTNRPARFDVVEISAEGILHVPGAFIARR